MVCRQSGKGSAAVPQSRPLSAWTSFVIAVLRALVGEHVGNVPVYYLRIVPQQIGRFVGAANLNDADLVIALIRKWHCRLLRDFP